MYDEREDYQRSERDQQAREEEADLQREEEMHQALEDDDLVDIMKEQGAM